MKILPYETTISIENQFQIFNDAEETEDEELEASDEADEAEAGEEVDDVESSEEVDDEAKEAEEA